LVENKSFCLIITFTPRRAARRLIRHGKRSGKAKVHRQNSHREISMKNVATPLITLLVILFGPQYGGIAYADSLDANAMSSPAAPIPEGAPENTVTGKAALSSNVSGTFNTANGAYALEKNTAGSENTATGRCALENTTTGSDNTANGCAALNVNTTGYANTATGSYALNANTSGYSNTSAGGYALYANTTGVCNTAAGRSALYSNGFYALYFNTTGLRNTADGTRALNYNSTGQDNIALGYEAGYKVTTGSSNIDIGSQGTNEDGGSIRIGVQGTQNQAFVAGVFGTTATGGVPVYVTSTGQLGTLSSSAKFKRDIQDMGAASDALLALRPVTFKYKTEIDPAGTPQFGLIAEEVEKVSPDLVVHNADHQVYSVRYEAVNAMLLNEFQKEHQALIEQQKTIADQQKLLQSLAARLDQLEQRR
jgi:hypothetical protein